MTPRGCCDPSAHFTSRPFRRFSPGSASIFGRPRRTRSSGSTRRVIRAIASPQWQHRYRIRRCAPRSSPSCRRGRRSTCLPSGCITSSRWMRSPPPSQFGRRAPRRCERHHSRRLLSQRSPSYLLLRANQLIVHRHPFAHRHPLTKLLPEHSLASLNGCRRRSSDYPSRSNLTGRDPPRCWRPPFSSNSCSWQSISRRRQLAPPSRCT